MIWGLNFETQPHITATRRYITLDAMRGIAALFVAARHFSETYQPGVPAPHFSYLAVDIFFLLSGFVLSLSYGEKLARGMTRKEFLIRRVIRLFPLYLLGTAISFLVAFWDFPHGRLWLATPGTVTVNAVAAALMLPSPTYHFSLFLFPFMIPAWSLFFELYVANLAFAAFGGRVTTRALLAVISLSLILLLAAAALRGSLDMGAEWHTFVGGIPRTLFSFFLGVLLQRWHHAHPPKLQIPSWAIVAALAVLLAAPFSGIAGRVYELVFVVLFFPALIFWGAEAREASKGVGAALGDTSYALYVIHYPLVVLTGRLLTQSGTGFAPLLEFPFLAGLAALAYGLHHMFDEPFRGWLTRHRARQALTHSPV